MYVFMRIKSPGVGTLLAENGILNTARKTLTGNI